MKKVIENPREHCRLYRNNNECLPAHYLQMEMRDSRHRLAQKTDDLQSTAFGDANAELRT